MTAVDVIVGRQPIFDGHRTVFGYELLFRTLSGLTAAEAAGRPGDEMTTDVILSAISIGVDRLVGSKRLFCNASRGVLTGVVPVLLPPEQTVVEIADSVLPHDEVLGGCHRLRDEGFALALDNVTCEAEVASFGHLVSMAKIDLRTVDPAALPRLVEYCRHYNLLVIAQKVETEEEFDSCVALGIDYLQGFLLARPAEIAGRTLDPGRLAQVRLAAHLLDHEFPISEIEEIVRGDPAVALQLLQLASAGAAGGMRRDVRTIREAIVVVGWRRLQSWISLLLVGGKGRASEEQLTTALARARACELVAQDVDRSLASMAFTAGMLSSFDLLLGIPLEEALRGMPLADEIRRATLDREGPLGRIVDEVVNYQLGEVEEEAPDGDQGVLATAALEGLLWSVEMTNALSKVA